MFDWLGQKYNDRKLINQASKVEKVIDDLFKANVKTKDIGGKFSTIEFNQILMNNLNEIGYE
jgi:isocitrate/isopropylmalate dehydrogenase